MSIIASNTGGGDFKPIPSGNHLARLYQIIDIGHQHGEYQGTPNVRHQVIFRWETPLETDEFEGVIKPLICSKFYTLSLSEKANLRADIEGWLSRTLTIAEEKDFDITAFLNKTCMVNIVHNEKGKAIVKGVTAVPKGFQQAPPAFNPVNYFSLDRWDDNAFIALPKGFQAIIRKLDEWKALNDAVGNAQESSVKTPFPGAQAEGVDETDIPF